MRAGVPRLLQRAGTQHPPRARERLHDLQASSSLPSLPSWWARASRALCSGRPSCTLCKLAYAPLPHQPRLAPKLHQTSPARLPNFPPPWSRFGCDDAPLGRRAGLFASFLEALQAQLAHGLQTTVGQGGGGQETEMHSTSSSWPSWPLPHPRPLHSAVQSPSGQQQAQPYGSPMMDELLEDSFLHRLCSQFFGMLHEERAAVAPALAAAAGRVSELLASTLGWGAAVVTELGAEAEDEDAPVVVEGVELPE